jgi:hypothetical protein
MLPMVADEGILYFGISTKYAIAFFNISRSIVSRFTCCSSCLILSSWLVFYFFLGTSGKGFVVPKLKTEPNRMRKKLKEIKWWIRDNRHRYRMKDLWLRLIAIVRGYMQYYCVTHNIPAGSKFIHNCRNTFYIWMNKRSQQKSISWEKFDLFTKRFPVPRLRITVNLI